MINLPHPIPAQPAFTTTAQENEPPPRKKRYRKNKEQKSSLNRFFKLKLRSILNYPFFLRKITLLPFPLRYFPCFHKPAMDVFISKKKSEKKASSTVPS